MKKHIAAAAIALSVITLMAGGADAAAKKKSSAGSSSSSASSVQTVTNSIGMKFVKVPAGSFMMGSQTTSVNCPADDPFTTRNEYEECRQKAKSSAPPEDETPAHRVIISKDFLIGQYEVTQEEWYKVMGNNPSEFKTDKVGEDSRNFPVEKVSWDDVQEFISRLNSKEGKEYRLPTEAEWEYACRSGGRDEKYCGGNDVDAVAWYGFEKSGKRTHRVGTKRPNGLGIYDMSGNVWEWVSDWYGESYYGSSPTADPQGPSSGSYRVLRGGSWGSKPAHVRASIRPYNTPGHRSSDLGFRLVSPVQ